MKRSKQIAELLDTITKVNDDELQPVEKDFMKAVRAAARKIKVDEIREELNKAGIDHTKDNGNTLNIILGYPDAPERSMFKRYCKEEEEKAIEKLETMGLEFSVGEGQKRGGRTARVIRVMIGKE